eukprot:TRINITY_DN9504_c0_g1_i1.p1 TRINITY_DN9504_c0_g1~~TRINITY_DN9504_c0_g1_i1.p1  ORF type:complete len:115 (+),score=14.01 TRINITY_DN9504_c0_g1_i1:521-865(+)
MLKQAIEEDESIIYCYNPICQYPAGFIAPFDHHQYFTCPRCEKKTCIICRDEMHIGITCSEFKKKSKNILSEQWIEKNTKKCPNCRYNIQKKYESDCDKMICRFNFFISEIACF